jgi:hypothetical protein
MMEWLGQLSHVGQTFQHSNRCSYRECDFLVACL